MAQATDDIITAPQIAPALVTLGRLRIEAQAEIDRLLSFLDATDADADLEGGGDEEPNSDDEPSLGSPEAHPSPYLTAGDRFQDQDRFWATGDRRDLEGDEHDGREPDVDEEPSLGASEPIEPDPRARVYWNGRLERDDWNAYDQEWWDHGCSDRDEEADINDEPQGDEERECSAEDLEHFI